MCLLNSFVNKCGQVPIAHDLAPDIVVPVTWIWGNRDLPAFGNGAVRVRAHDQTLLMPTQLLNCTATYWP